MAVVSLTNDTGVLTQLETSSIVRLRQATASERSHLQADGRDGATRIDYAFDLFVREAPAAAASAVEGAGDIALGQLTMTNGWPVWFNAKLAKGPIPVPATAGPDVKSALSIGNKTQYVRNTHAEVRDLLRVKGGTPLPIPPPRPASMPEAAGGAEHAAPPAAVWDEGVPLR